MIVFGNFMKFMDNFPDLSLGFYPEFFDDLFILYVPNCIYILDRTTSAVLPKVLTPRSLKVISVLTLQENVSASLSTE